MDFRDLPAGLYASMRSSPTAMENFLRMTAQQKQGIINMAYEAQNSTQMKQLLQQVEEFRE